MVEEHSHPLVAVIEDDESARSALGRLLQAGGFDSALFDSAETFIASRRERRWRCLVVDVQLSGMSGIDLQHRLRAEGIELPVIIITANRADEIRERAQQAGCAAFLLKPFCGNAMLALLASIASPSRT
jgi:FixJ family two-component response regulator